MKESLGFYEISYPSGIKQVKELITEESYSYYKILTKQQHMLSAQIIEAKKKKDKETETVLRKMVEDLRKTLEEFEIEFFVVNSPMYNAISTGIIHIEDCGNEGDYPVTVMKIDSPEDTLNYFNETQDEI